MHGPIKQSEPVSESIMQLHLPLLAGSVVRNKKKIMILAEAGSGNCLCFSTGGLLSDIV